MSHVGDGKGAMSRRSLLGVAGTAVGAAVLMTPAADAEASTSALSLAPASGPGRFVRPLGAADLPCTGPGLRWNDPDGGPISVTLNASGTRPVRISARLAAAYGGPDGTYFGVSFAEDGVDLCRDEQRGYATLCIDGSTVALGTLEASTVRQVSAGPHTWTLRVRHEQPMNDDAAQRSYVRTRRVAPLEFTATEL